MVRLAEVRKAVVTVIGAALAFFTQTVDVLPEPAKPYALAAIGVLTTAGVYLARNEVDAIVSGVDGASRAGESLFKERR